MDIIRSKGGYFAVHVGNDACVRWHGFSFKPWHVGVFAKTRHGVTLVGVVSGVKGDSYTWWANYHVTFYPENYARYGHNAPADCATLDYQGSYKDFIGCVEAAIEFLGAMKISFRPQN